MGIREIEVYADSYAQWSDAMGWPKCGRITVKVDSFHPTAPGEGPNHEINQKVRDRIKTAIFNANEQGKDNFQIICYGEKTEYFHILAIAWRTAALTESPTAGKHISSGATT